MQLRSQAAMQQLREREQAQQAMFLMKRMEEIDAENAGQRRYVAAIKAGADLDAMLKDKFPDPVERMGHVVPVVALGDPKAGADLALANQRLVQAQTEGKTTPHQKALEEQAGARIRLDEKKLELDKLQEQRLSARERRLDARFKLNESEKAKIKSIYTRIDRLTEELDKLKPETGLFNKAPNPKFVEKQAMIEKLYKEADTLATKGEVGVKGAPATPAVGGAPRVRVRSKDGKTGTIPASQLEQALQEGFTELGEAD